MKIILYIFLIISFIFYSSLVLAQEPITLDMNNIYKELISPLNERIWFLQIQLLQANERIKQLENEIKKLKENETSNPK